MAWRCRREKLRRSCGGRVTDGGDNGATGDLGSVGHRKAAEAMDDAGGAVDGAKQPASRSIPAVDAGLHGQQSAVRPADGDRPDEKTLDGQAGVGDDVTAADLGPDPHAATRLSLNELAGMETASSTASAVHSSMSQPSASANDSLASRSARDWLTLRAARREPIHAPSTGIMAVRAGVGPRGR